MGDTRDHKQVEGELEGENRRLFTQAVLTDLRALEKMLAEHMFEVGDPRIGAEQELFLVDREYHPSPGALKVLEKIDDPHFTTELALFNLEMNADPQPFRGKGLSAMDAQLTSLLEKLRGVCAELGLIPVLTGILPTIQKSDLGMENMVPSPRYLALNRATTAMRGEAYDLSIKGMDELLVKHDTVMVESCNASFQVHLQVDPDKFARFYNLAQALAGPVLSVATNSPILFGKRLWAETRIAVFEQAVDTRQKRLHLRERQARVTFGKRWVKKSVLEIYKEDVARFRTLVGTDLDEDALETLEQGRVPQLKALRLHNGTVYRWNRACYGLVPGSEKPHLRIELRVLPSGPTIADEIANAALWLGLMSELGATIEDVTHHMEFDHAIANFYSAAREGLGARFTWLDGEEVLAQSLLLDKLLPLAAAGLARGGADAGDAQRYLGIIEHRARTMRTGSRWAISSIGGMKDRGSLGEKLTALTAATVARQMTGRTVADWERARLDESGSAKSSYHKVSQYMTTDIFTVQPDDAIELVADLMGWERIRHVPVEDGQGNLVGLVSYRAVLRYFSEREKDKDKPTSKTSVSDIMRRDVMTITPDTPTLEAIALLRRYRIGCLPVVQDGHLVAIVTEQDFMNIASELLEQKLGG